MSDEHDEEPEKTSATDAERMRDASAADGKPAGKPVPTSVPGKNGGTLFPGDRGQAVGFGRPSNVLRDRLKEGFAERIPVLESIADGEPVRKTRVSLASVWRYVHCPKCQHRVEPDDPEGAGELTITGTVSATPRERIAALEVMAKVGIGTLKALSREEVSGRLLETIRVIKATLPEEQAADLLQRIAPVWR